MLAPPSRLGFGVSGAHGSPLIARRETVRLIETAYAAGVQVFDTAPAYGAGEAERRLGAAVRGLGRDRVHLTTKAGVFSAGVARRRRDFSPDAVEASLSGSLSRLGVAGVDVLFLHGAGAHELTGALLERLDALRRAGAFAALGAAGRGPELDAALATDRFDAVMAPVHPFFDAVETARLRRAASAGKAVFAIETAGDAAPDLRAPRRIADLYGLAKAARARMTGGAGRGRVPAPQGLQAALARPEVGCALFTSTRRRHVAECAALAGAADGLG